MHEEIFVYHVPLPDGIHEVVLPCRDGYTVYLNDKLSYEQQLEKYKHAVNGHIAHNDFEKFNVQEIEYEAHNRKEN